MRFDSVQTKERPKRRVAQPPSLIAPEMSVGSGSATVAPGSELSREPDWRSRFRGGVVATDTLIVAAAVVAAHLMWFETSSSSVFGASVFSYAMVSMGTFVCWLIALATVGAWHRNIVGTGSLEYGRVSKASFVLFGLVAIVAFLGEIDIARGYVAIALPVGFAGLLIGRAAWGTWLRGQRRRGQMMHRIVVVGSRTTASQLADELRAEPTGRYAVVGLCVPQDNPGSGSWAGSLDGFDVLDDLNGVVDVAERAGASTIVVTNSEAFPRAKVRKLSWLLESTHLELVLAPMLTDITGPRIHEEATPGLLLIHVQKPRLHGPQQWFKSSFDFCFALVALVLLSPLMLATAIAIKLDGGGPVFFRQTRVGLGQRPFKIWKFRTMKADPAQPDIPSVKSDQQSCGPVFGKFHSRQQVTGVGNFLRRTSIDELPQLINVIAGKMSIVGPRPLVPWEGTEIDGFVGRRTLVKPGLTGLWQVSGRSTVTGDRAARLDLLYVENWSFVGDLGIILRTVRAVVGHEGAV